MLKKIAYGILSILFFLLFLNLSKSIGFNYCFYEGGDFVITGNCYIYDGELALYGNMYIMNDSSVYLGLEPGTISYGNYYETKITIIENSGNDLTNYQVMINITDPSILNNIARSDCGDLRFYSQPTTNPYPVGGLDYWIEACNTSSYVTVWVEVPSIPANSQTTIYMYYGNPTAVPQSNGYNTFIFYDDFEGTSIDSNRWPTIVRITGGEWSTESSAFYEVLNSNLHVNHNSNDADGDCASTGSNLNGWQFRSSSISFNNGIIIKAKTSFSNVDWYRGFLDMQAIYYNESTGEHWGLSLYYRGAYQAYLTAYLDGIRTFLYDITEQAGGDEVFFYKINSTHVELNINGTYSYYYSTTGTISTNGEIVLSSYAGACLGDGINYDSYYDWVFVAQYVYPEPTVKIGETTISPATIYFDKWKYRKPIIINENYGSNITEYQLLLKVNLVNEIDSGKVNLNLSDIRFTYYNRSSGLEEPIAYWVEKNNYEENFDDNIAQGWVVSSGTWTVSNNVYNKTDTNAAYEFSYYSLDLFDDVVVEADVTIRTGQDSLYVACRYLDDNNWYAAVINDYWNVVGIHKMVNGIIYKYESPYTIVPNQAYNLRLECNGPTIKMYLNGSLILTITDGNFTKGYIAVGGWQTGGEFDNIKAIRMYNDIWIKVPYLPANSQTTIYMYYGNPTAASKSDKMSVFSYSKPEPIFYIVSPNSGTSTNYSIISFADNNEVVCGSTTYYLNKGSIITCALSRGSSIKATKPIFADAEVDAITPAAPIAFMGDEFINAVSRYSDRFGIYAFEAATVNIYDGSTLEISQNIASGSVATIINDITLNYRVTSTGKILLTHDEGAYDAYIVYPATKELYGVSSNYLLIGNGPYTTKVDIYLSNGNKYSVVLNPNTSYNITSLGFWGTAPAVYIVANNSIGANGEREGDGGEAQVLVSEVELNTEYYVPSDAQHVSLGGPLPFNCSVNGGTPVSASGGPFPYPYKLLIGSVTAGSYINCTAPVWGYYEQSATNDEHNLFGIKQFRKKVPVEPTYIIGLEEVLGTDFFRYIYIYSNASLYIYRYSSINEKYVSICTSDAQCNEYDCTTNCTVGCDVGTGDLYYFCDDYQCIGGFCQPNGSLRCNLYQVCDTCSGETAPSYTQGDTIIDYYSCTAAGQTSCPSQSFTDYCINTTYLNESYCSSNVAAFSLRNCDDYDCTTNCVAQCDLATGDIYNYCDDYSCSVDACQPTGTAKCSLVEDCSDICSGETTTSPFTQDTIIDYELCSLTTQTSCPSQSFTDYCINTTYLRDYYCSGADYTFGDINCDSYDGNYCAPGNILETRDYSCGNGACTYTVTSSYDCDQDDACYNYGDNLGCGTDPTAENRDYYCSGGACLYTSTTVNCDANDICSNVCENNVIYSYKDYYVNASCACAYTLGSVVEDCTTKASTDTDAGDDPTTQGTVTDYTGCNAGSSTCDVYNTYTDTCVDAETLTEYYPSGSSYASTTYTCDNLGQGNYCSNNAIYFDDWGCSTGACVDLSDTLVEDCTTKASTDTDAGDDPTTQGTVTDYTGCNAGSSTCDVYNTYTDTCVDAETLTEYYPSGSSYASTTYTCDNLGQGNYCDTTSGDIYFDDWGCSTGACVDQADTLVQDCANSCTDTDGLDYLTQGTVTDNDLCAAGDTSCPSNTYTDYCSDSITLIEYTCSGADMSSQQVDCSLQAIEDCCTTQGAAYYCPGTAAGEFCSGGQCTYSCSNVNLGGCFACPL